MAQFLRYAPDPEAMDVAYSRSYPPLLTATVWNGDHPGVGKHNVPCPVCWDKGAVMHDNPNIGATNQVLFQPCPSCRHKGWLVVRVPGWLRFLFPKTFSPFPR